MSPSKAYVVLATWLVAGCASAPEVVDETPIATLAATASSTTAAPGAASSSAANAAAIVPDTVLDANDLIARTPARPICRDILRPGSNVHVTRCMSAEDWKVWERIEAQNAAEMVRMMQGGRYR